MAIEEPVAHVVDHSEFVPSGSTLIGEFYDKIQQTFETPRTPPCPRPGRSTWAGSKGTFIMASLDDVRKGIDLIKRQGEGTAAAPFEASNPDELAHFYQFGEMAHGHRLTRTRALHLQRRGSRDAGRSSGRSGRRHAARGEGVQPALHRHAPGPGAGMDGGGTTMLRDAVGKMFGLGGVAEQLFQGGVGPGFIVVDDSANR